MATTAQKHSDAGKGKVQKQAAKRERPSAPPIPQFDLLIHERMRLGIVSALLANDKLSFADLKRLLKATDGNLSVHAHKLEEAGYISCSKYFEGRMPRTEYKLTSSGRQAVERYLRDMETMIRAVRASRSGGQRG